MLRSRALRETMERLRVGGREALTLGLEPFVEPGIRQVEPVEERAAIPSHGLTEVLPDQRALELMYVAFNDAAVEAHRIDSIDGAFRWELATHRVEELFERMTRLFGGLSDQNRATSLSRLSPGSSAAASIARSASWRRGSGSGDPAASTRARPPKV